ncbi:nicotinate-nucleotide--dimethylbenzimidazole phosphoribosyltransferase [Marinobacter halodurans]|uniref:Nicotinate-nucleotide--dimethylbenzimidazole phosphoribosyltransferase n=1 Tax=Marinobacter halodurans TaxID=2528979 RepID=A0ABY1ZFY4_9GAMM|nr:nicotinate-nucleotide--dimethylbenzimidazole phosphoribosyltransferase [Marinobacter halodurans]TBW50339.1 nicotinate-nucleotide--dimethylbenzimidazole phosphoribosyltransferase [Marinobacter halodurans]
MTLPVAWKMPLPLPDPACIEGARAQQNSLTKPPGSLGRLEEAAVALCGQQHRAVPSVDRVHIAVFAGDHGVCDEGVSAFPQAVTAQMIANFAGGGAAISVLARELGAALEVVNLGTVGNVPADLPGVIDASIAPATGNIAVQPAMTDVQVAAALTAGDRAAARAAEAGADLLIAGDMGIGNTTTAAAVACALLYEAPEALVGAGTGLAPEAIQHKATVVGRALNRHGENREPLAVLQSLGGFEIAAIAGAYLGAAARGIPVLVDGFIASAGALIAVRQQPTLRSWLHFGHRSAEQGHRRVLDALEAEPLLDLGMRLGEGSGAATAVTLLRSACALHNRMASFADAGVSDGKG